MDRFCRLTTITLCEIFTQTFASVFLWSWTLPVCPDSLPPTSCPYMAIPHWGVLPAVLSSLLSVEVNSEITWTSHDHQLRSLSLHPSVRLTFCLFLLSEQSCFLFSSQTVERLWHHSAPAVFVKLIRRVLDVRTLWTVATLLRCVSSFTHNPPRY